MMSPEELAARNREIGAETDHALLVQLALAGDAGLLPGRDVAELLGVSLRTASRSLTRLVDRGLAVRDGLKRAWATPAGRSEVGARMSGLELAPTLDVALACFPSEALRAFIRLQLAAVPARWHLVSQHSAGWPGFIAPGPTGTGKTSVALFVCRVYGLLERQAIKVAQWETPGSLVARHYRDGKAATGWRVERSPALASPYLCVDEWEKAAVAVQATAGGLLLGNAVDELEGERFELRPTVYVTLNTGREGLQALHSAHVRRSVVLDTTSLKPLLANLDRDMDRLLESGEVPIPRLSVEQLRPPVRALPRDLRELMRSELRAGLTDEGWELTQVEAVARIAIGRAALTDGDLEQAVLATVYDYLTCASTVDHARADYSARLAGRLGAGALLPSPEAVHQQREIIEQRRRQRAHEQDLDRDRLVEARGRLKKKVAQMRASLDGRGLRDCSNEQQEDAYALAERLREVLPDVSAAQTWEALQAAEDRAGDPYERADELLAEIEQERTTRSDMRSRLAPTQRSRGSVQALAREMATNLLAMARQAHGADLDALHQQAQQLERDPPIGEGERIRRLAEFQAAQAEFGRRINPYGY
jgi:Mn-dependent DtxR family transcriptional regulator